MQVFRSILYIVWLSWKFGQVSRIYSSGQVEMEMRPRGFLGACTQLCDQTCWLAEACKCFFLSLVSERTLAQLVGAGAAQLRATMPYVVTM